MSPSEAEGFYRYQYHFGHIETLELKKEGKLVQRIYASQQDEKDATPYINQRGRWKLNKGVEFEDVFIISRIVGNSVVKLGKPAQVSILSGLYFEHWADGLVIRVFDEADMAYHKIR